MSEPIDAGPMIDVPDRIAICAEHGWWFPAEPGEHCPEIGCRAVTHHYVYSVAVKGPEEL